LVCPRLRKRIERFEHTDERWLIAERVSHD
jgi:hypothetical protein